MNLDRLEAQLDRAVERGDITEQQARDEIRDAIDEAHRELEER